MRKRILIVVGILVLFFIGFIFIFNQNKIQNFIKQSEQSFAQFSSDKPLLTIGNLGLAPIFNSFDSPIIRIQSKSQLIEEHGPEWIKNGGNPNTLQALGAKVSEYGEAKDFIQAEKTIDEILTLIGVDATSVANLAEKFHSKERDEFL